MASTEPCVSALTTTFSTLEVVDASWSKRFSSVTLARRLFLAQRLGFLARCSASSRAAFSSSTTLNSRPASGTPFKPRTLTATEGAGFLEALAFFVDQRAHAAVVLAANNDIAHAQRAFAHQHGGGGAAGLQAGFDHVAFGAAVRIGFEFQQIGLEQNHLDELIDALLGQRGNIDENRVATPIVRHQAFVLQLLADLQRSWRWDGRSC